MGLPTTRWLYAADPVRIVRGSDEQLLEAMWAEERARWGNVTLPEVPIGIGYLAYDLGRRFERLRSVRPEPSNWDDLEFRFYDAICLADADDVEIFAQNESAGERLSATLGSSPRPQVREFQTVGPWEEMETSYRHLAAVQRALDYIHAGDIYQVNLARRLGVDLPKVDGWNTSLEFALHLSDVAPAPFSFWFSDGERDRALIGNSPERFLHRSPDGWVETCPIKGTRRRIPGEDSEIMVADLLASEKDRAEHVMIVDLERNDLGRVCRTGSVRVTSLCQVLTLPTVHHLVSTIGGQLRPDVGLSTLLRATFPGGSVTGAPKIRAMEIIDELEPVCRGPYTGATGWLGAAGDLDLALAIRTADYANGRLTLWVGGGIVADSVPEEELAETWAKAAAFTRLSRF
jgi:para-aminobenzoate synthetase component 1